MYFISLPVKIHVGVYHFGLTAVPKGGSMLGPFSPRCIWSGGAVWSVLTPCGGDEDAVVSGCRLGETVLW